MTTNKQTILDLADLEKQWQDCNQTLQKVDKRIWGICARVHGRRDESGKYDLKAIGDLQKSVINGKCQLSILTITAAPLVASRLPLAEGQLKLEEQMCEITPTLPIRDWFCNHRGLKDVLLAHLVGVGSKDWNDFPKICQLWKWYGLHVVNGKAPRREKGVQPDFSSIRRAVAIGQLGENLIRQNQQWKSSYDWYKAKDYTKMKDAGLTILPQARITEKRAATGKYISEGRMHNRARRYMTKQFMRAMWEEWTGDNEGELPGFVKHRPRKRLSDEARV